MFTGARKKREMDWQLVASYFTVKSKDMFCSVVTLIMSNTDISKYPLISKSIVPIHFQFLSG